MSTESILFGRAGLTTPTRLGSLFRLTFSVTSRHNGNYDSNTKCNGHQYGSNDSSRCRMHHASDAINSITTQRQLYLTRITVRTSGTVLGEHTVGQTFYVTMPATLLQTFELTLRALQTAKRVYQRVGSGCQVRQDFVTRAWYKKVSQKHGGFQNTP